MPRLTSNIPIPIGHAHCWERATPVALMRCRAARKDAQLELRAPSKDHDSNKTERALVEKRATVLAVPSRRTPKHVTETSQTSQTSQTSKLAAPPEARSPSYRYERIPRRESLLARNIVSGSRAGAWHFAVSLKGCSPNTDWHSACGNCGNCGNCFSPSSMPGSRRRRIAPAAICSRAAWR